jgi:hypothetical protein
MLPALVHSLASLCHSLVRHCKVERLSLSESLPVSDSLKDSQNYNFNLPIKRGKQLCQSLKLWQSYTGRFWKIGEKHRLFLVILLLTDGLVSNGKILLLPLVRTPAQRTKIEVGANGEILAAVIKRRFGRQQR